jgi:hypothetical protein
MPAFCCTPVNEVGRCVYCLELLGYPVIQRTLFEFQRRLVTCKLLRQPCFLEAACCNIIKSVVKKSFSDLIQNICREPIATVDPG